MKIKISKENYDKIQGELDAVNGKATQHTYWLAGQIAELADAAEKQAVALLGSKKASAGAIYRSCSGKAVAGRYDYTRKATLVELTRGTTGWCLTAVSTATIYQHSGASYLMLTEAQDAIAVAKCRDQYRMQK